MNARKYDRHMTGKACAFLFILFLAPRLSAQDGTVKKKFDITVDTAMEAFSPNGDGIQDTQTFGISSTTAGADGWSISVSPAAGDGAAVFQKKGTGKIPKKLEWDGTLAGGGSAPDGRYWSEITVIKGRSNIAVRTNEFVLDTTVPSARIYAEEGVAAPGTDGGGMTGSVSVFQTGATLEQLWSGRITADDGTVVRAEEWKGTPGTFVWDGKDAEGKPVSAGRYSYVLSATDAAGNAFSAGLPLGVGDAVFVPDAGKPAGSNLKGNPASPEPVPLQPDTSPPRLKIVAAPQPFSPDGDGVNDRLEIRLSARDDGAPASWRLDVIDPAGNTFMRFAGEGAVPEKIVWDGLNETGELIQADLDYRLSFTAEDAAANAAQTGAKLRVDILVLREGDNWRIPLPGIAFPPESGDLDAVPEDMRKANDETLDRLALLLKKFKTYTVLVEGHANSTRAAAGKTPDPVEQEKELVPLSALRALAVKNALIARGIAPGRLESAGVGGERPQVDFGDTEQLWKNRRVEFMLRK